MVILNAVLFYLPKRNRLFTERLDLTRQHQRMLNTASTTRCAFCSMGCVPSNTI